MTTLTGANTTFDNDGFWPDIDAQAVRTVLGLREQVSELRLEQAVLNAMLRLNRELRTMKQRWRAAGYNTLADVPAERLYGHSEWLLLYRRALYCAAGAQLGELVGDYRRAYRHAADELLGSCQPTQDRPE